MSDSQIALPDGFGYSSGDAAQAGDVEAPAQVAVVTTDEQGQETAPARRAPDNLA